jgi:DNA-binding transcriptional ArsR family regulator
MDQPTLDGIEQAVMAFDEGREETRHPVSALFGGLADDVIDLVLEHRFGEAEPLYRRMQRILDGFVVQRGLAVEQGDGCVAGQIRAFATVLGAISQRLSKSFEAQARKHLRAPIYQALCDALMEGEATTTVLRKATGEQMETVSRKLGTLRNLGLVTSYSLGRNVYSQLSPVARTLYEEIRNDRHRPPAPRQPLQPAFSPEQVWEIAPETGSHAVLGWAT